MAEAQKSGYLSIGEVLGLLLEEFPDITISKIRFLESQGLISPERTASGYRKFYDEDVELLRVILTEQRENYLPLRVIKDRLDSGEIDPTGEHLRPNGHAQQTGQSRAAEGSGRAGSGDGDASGDAGDHDDRDTDADDDAEVPPSSIRSHPASRSSSAAGRKQADGAPAARSGDGDRDSAAGATTGTGDGDDGDDAEGTGTADARLLPGVLLDRGELCSLLGITDAELAELESYGIVTSRPGAGVALYGDDAVEIGRPAVEFLRLGIDARHLRAWRTAAEREASLYEQLIAPKLRQRNPKARAEALALLQRLDSLGGTLRQAMTRSALRHHFDG